MVSPTAIAVSECAARLRSAGILREEVLVAESATGKGEHGHIEVRNPGTGVRIGRVPSLGRSSVDLVVPAAQRAFRLWSGTKPTERRTMMRAWFDLVMARREELAELVTLEQGEPLGEAGSAIAYAASFLEWYVEQANAIYEETPASRLPGASMSVRRVPVGLVLAITPWNFPSAMVARKTAAALAAGCAVIVRPAEETPFSAIPRDATPARRSRARRRRSDRAVDPRACRQEVRGSRPRCAGFRRTARDRRTQTRSWRNLL